MTTAQRQRGGAAVVRVKGPIQREVYVLSGHKKGVEVDMIAASHIPIDFTGAVVSKFILPIAQQVPDREQELELKFVSLVKLYRSGKAMRWLSVEVV